MRHPTAPYLGTTMKCFLQNPSGSVVAIFAPHQASTPVSLKVTSGSKLKNEKTRCLKK